VAEKKPSEPIPGETKMRKNLGKMVNLSMFVGKPISKLKRSEAELSKLRLTEWRMFLGK